MLGDIKWYKNSSNETILSHLGKDIITSRAIHLWGDYPYLYGQGTINEKDVFFAYNLDTKELKAKERLRLLTKSKIANWA
ncbi:MAG: hypothetical protein R3Y46_03825 [Opitutales bacterium]